MTTEIKNFDPNEALKSVKERIKDSFVSLIPNEQWDSMVKKEIDSYFLVKDEGYGERGRSSNFTREVHACLNEEVKVRVKSYLQENFKTIWESNGIPICDKKIEDFILHLTNMIGSHIQQAFKIAGYSLK